MFWTPLLDGAAAELCDRITVIGRGAANGRDVSRVGYCVCLLHARLPHRDAPAEAVRAVIAEERAVVVDNSEGTWLHAA